MLGCLNYMIAIRELECTYSPTLMISTQKCVYPNGCTVKNSIVNWENFSKLQLFLQCISSSHIQTPCIKKV